MNWDTVEGKWKQMKGQFHQKWGEITDDELEYAKGRKDELIGKLQERYGMSKDEASQALDRWAAKVEIEPDEDNSMWRSMWNNIEGSWHEMKGHFKESYGDVQDDELTESRGHRDVLAGIIQRKYDVNRGQALEMVDQWAFENRNVMTKGGRQ